MTFPSPIRWKIATPIHKEKSQHEIYRIYKKNSTSILIIDLFNMFAHSMQVFVSFQVDNNEFKKKNSNFRNFKFSSASHVMSNKLWYTIYKFYIVCMLWMRIMFDTERLFEFVLSYIWWGRDTFFSFFTQKSKWYHIFRRSVVMLWDIVLYNATFMHLKFYTYLPRKDNSLTQILAFWLTWVGGNVGLYQKGVDNVFNDKFISLVMGDRKVSKFPLN